MRVRSGVQARWLVLAVLALAGGALLLPIAVVAQEEEEVIGPTLQLTGWGGVSLREGAESFRVGKDLVSFGVRATLWRRGPLHPWVQADRFERPNLVCVVGIPCTDQGWLLRGGILVPFSDDESVRGVHPYLTAGLGAGFSDNTFFSYLGGIGLHWTLWPRIAPSAEFRFERVPGLRFIYTLNGGIRIGLL